MMVFVTDSVDSIRTAIIDDPGNAGMTAKGWQPIFTAGPEARIVIVGQAPGAAAQETGIPWNDASGKKLRTWLGLSDEQFYDPNLVALIPMDFYYPGKGKHGDMPPRQGFAAKWHPPLLALMPRVSLTVLIGAYAQDYYLGRTAKQNLTETVRDFADYLPDFFPLVHPSPLNFRWQAKNPWFEETVIPELQRNVARVIGLIKIV